MHIKPIIPIVPTLLAMASPNLHAADAFTAPPSDSTQSVPHPSSYRSINERSVQYSSPMMTPQGRASSRLMSSPSVVDPYLTSTQNSFEALNSDNASIEQIRQSLHEKSHAELPLQPNCQRDLKAFFDQYDKAYRFRGFHHRITIESPALSDTLMHLFSNIVGESESKGITTDMLIRSFMNKNQTSQRWHADLGRIQLRTIIPLMGESTQYCEPTVANQFLVREPLVKGLPDSDYVGTIPADQIRSIPENSALLYTTEYDKNKRGFLENCHPLPHRTPPAPSSNREEDFQRAFMVIDFI